MPYWKLPALRKLVPGEQLVTLLSLIRFYCAIRASAPRDLRRARLLETRATPLTTLANSTKSPSPVGDGARNTHVLHIYG